VMEVDHPKAGRIKQLNIPFKLSGYALSMRRAPPLLGQHTDEVLRDLGFGSAQIDELRGAGTVA